MATSKNPGPAKATPASAQAEPGGSRNGKPWSRRRKAIVGTIIGVVVLAVVAVLVSISYLTSPAYKQAQHDAGTTSTPTPSVTPIAVPTSAPIAQAAAIEPGLTAQITKFEAVQGTANAPGEVSAPSVRFTVTITNNTSKSVSLTTAVVTSTYGTAQTPALQLYAPGGVNLPSTVAAGQSVSGVYLFSIPVADRGNVRLEIDYSVKVPPLVFQGAIPH